MNANEYVERLGVFCHCTINNTVSDNKVKIRIDSEISYQYDFTENKMTEYERGKISNVIKYKNDKMGLLNFGLMIYYSLKEEIDYNADIDFDSIITLEELNDTIKKHFDSKLFRIGEVVDKKWCLIKKDDNYEIVFLNEDKLKIIESDKDRSFVFNRFYNELTYATSFLNTLNKYEETFDEKFTEGEILCALKLT